MENLLTLEDVQRRINQMVAIFGSAQALADKVGVSQQTISKYQNGRLKPGPAMLKFLGLKVVTYYEHS